MATAPRPGRTRLPIIVNNRSSFSSLPFPSSSFSSKATTLFIFFVSFFFLPLFDSSSVVARTTSNAFDDGPCLPGSEIYLANFSLILCVDIQTGAQRIFKNVTADGDLLPSMAIQFAAVNDQIFYSGWTPNDKTFGQNVVEIDTKTGRAVISKSLHMRNNYVTGWNELLFDSRENRFLCSYDDDWVRYFYYFDSPTSDPTLFTSFSLPCEDQECATFTALQGLAPKSVLDTKRSMYYGILSGGLGDKWGGTWILSLDLQTKKYSLSPPTQHLAGLQTIALHPTNNKLYGWLSYQKRLSSSSVYLFNTSIIEIDPKTGNHSTFTLLDLPGDRVIAGRNPGVPYLVSFDWHNHRVTAMFSELDAASSKSWQSLKTFDLQTGRMLYNVKTPLSLQLPYSWGLAYMTYTKQ